MLGGSSYDFCLKLKCRELCNLKYEIGRGEINFVDDDGICRDYKRF